MEPQAAVDASIVAEIETVLRDVSDTHTLPYFGKLAAADIREKAPGDIVTIADRDTETALTEHLVSLVPNSKVVGEEATSSDPTLLEHLRTTGPLWIIDPIDGTQNFAAGNPRFATLVTLVLDGQPAYSWSYAPAMDIMATAMAGAGTHLNGRRVRVTPPVSHLGQIDIAAPQPHWWPAPFAPLADNLRAAGATLSFFDTAGLSYVDIVIGRPRVLLMTWESAWDHAAGLLLLREAGGVSMALDGRAFDLQGGNALPIIAAPSRACAQLVRAALLGAK